MLQTTAAVDRIANKMANSGPSEMQGVEFGDVRGIISTAIAALIDCFLPDDGEQAQTYVRERYKQPVQVEDKHRGYKRSLFRATTRRVKFANRHARLTWEQSREIASGILDEIRLGDRQQMSMVIREHDQPKPIIMNGEAVAPSPARPPRPITYSE